MMDMFYIKDSSIHGRGCFATRDIIKGEIVEYHVLPLQLEDFYGCCPVCLSVNTGSPFGVAQWRFGWDNENALWAFVVGPVTFCNHSVNSNIKFHTKDNEKKTMSFIITEDIKKDEEVLLCYGDDITFN